MWESIPARSNPRDSCDKPAGKFRGHARPIPRSSLESTSRGRCLVRRRARPTPGAAARRVADRRPAARRVRPPRPGRIPAPPTVRFLRTALVSWTSHPLHRASPAGVRTFSHPEWPCSTGRNRPRLKCTDGGDFSRPFHESLVVEACAPAGRIFPAVGTGAMKRPVDENATGIMPPSDFDPAGDEYRRSLDCRPRRTGIVAVVYDRREIDAIGQTRTAVIDRRYRGRPSIESCAQATTRPQLGLAT